MTDVARTLTGPVRAALLATLLGVVTSATTGASPAAAGATSAGHATSRVVVAGEPGRLAEVRRQVRLAGGREERVLPVISGLSATLPAERAAALRQAPGVRSVTPDTAGRLTGVDPALGYDPGADDGSLSMITKIVSADGAWKRGSTGSGVDIAMIDSGVVPVPGLTGGNVVNGPDLSVESVNPELRHLDTYGHGTHIASVIAGRDAKDTGKGYAQATGRFTGIAPDARLISIKVAAADGGCDVSQVIAAVDWVVQHGRTNGLDVRVLNLAYGTDSTQPAALDPLVYAVENAWRAGIAVVVASGNDGLARQELANPASSPLVIAVGASDPGGNPGIGNDTVPAFAQRGTVTRSVDLIAPGVHVLGLRVPGSALDLAAPDARVGTRFIRGSGTSQAAAVVSGLAALYLSRYPAASPDQVKAGLIASAQVPSTVNRIHAGYGVPNALRSVSNQLPAAAQPPSGATGLGSLDAARGSAHLDDGDAELRGEVDIFGRAWDGAGWAARSAAGTAWSGGTWNGSTWTGSDWTGTSWSGQAWADYPLAPQRWSGAGWSGESWSSYGWGGVTWHQSSWGSHAWRRR